jgi:small basic protein
LSSLPSSSPQPLAAASAPVSGRRQRARRIVWPITAFLLGFVGAYLFFAGGVPLPAAEYLSLAVLAGIDSVFGGVRAGVERKFRSDIFLSGFLVNMLLAVILVFVGDKIGVTELYLAAVVTLGGRMFLNLSVIRRHWLDRPPTRGEK